MTTLTDYRVLRDGTGDGPIEINGEQSLSFGLPGRVEFNDGIERPIIGFKYNPSSNANNLRLEVSIRGQNIVTISNIDSGTPLVYWEIFNGSLLNEVDDNIVTFRVEGESGNIAISDVFVFFQRSGF